ncbi:17616_t:CDS:2 [Funneliformis geosporum]|nr:17616_t:CDS:2 [Funneliformis geosporum]
MATIHGFSSYISNNNLSIRTFEKVKGHCGDIYNNIADNLAKLEIQYPEILSTILKSPLLLSNIINLHRNDDLKSLTRQQWKLLFLHNEDILKRIAYTF